MAGRSPARFLAPLALAAFVVALFMIVSSSTSPDGDDSEPNQATESRPSSSGDDAGGEDGQQGERRQERGRRRYTIQPGDTPSGIAEETGVPLEDILRLNPELDPQALTPGTRIRLREREG